MGKTKTLQHSTITSIAKYNVSSWNTM